MLWGSSVPGEFRNDCRIAGKSSTNYDIDDGKDEAL